jgi:hypothetical protein
MSRDELLRRLGPPTTTTADNDVPADDQADEGVPPAREIWVYQDVPPGYRTTVVLEADRVASRHRLLTSSAAARTARARAPRQVEGWQPANTLATLALVFAFALPLVGVVLGILARGEIARTGQPGRGLATAGLVLGLVFTIVAAVVAGLVAAAASP